MEQLTLNISNESEVKIIASSSYNFQIELLKKMGKDDLPDILDISKQLSKIYGNHVMIDERNVMKYFNENTLPFLARYNQKIIGYIIGVPLEHFTQESWCKYDTNLNKKNTIYTYAFIIKEKYRKSGGYGKTLKMIYLNWAKKRGFKFVTGHVAQSVVKNFKAKVETVKVFSNWYGTNIPFEYYRRKL